MEIISIVQTVRFECQLCLPQIDALKMKGEKEWKLVQEFNSYN